MEFLYPINTISLDGKVTRSVYTQTQPSETGQPMMDLKYKLMHWRSEANIYLVYISIVHDVHGAINTGRFLKNQFKIPPKKSLPQPVDAVH